MTAHPRTAWVHIGPHKTGTTALQYALADARPGLNAAGYRCLTRPDQPENLHICFCADPFSARLAENRWNGEPAPLEARRAALLSELSAEAEQSAPRDLILSDEGLSLMQEDEVRRLVDFLLGHCERIRVIAYLREPQSWISSFAQQALKWSGATLDEVFAAPRLPGYALRFAPWLKVVGRDNMDFRIYRKGRSGGTLADFARVIGCDPAVFVPSSTNWGNESVSHRSAIMLSAINAACPPFVNSRFNPARPYRLNGRDLLPGRRFALPRETVLAARDALAEERAVIDDLIGRKVFAAPAVPRMSLANWFGREREALETFALTHLDNCRMAQNEAALRNHFRACKLRDTDRDAARTALSNAIRQVACHWATHPIAQEAAETDHPEQAQIIARRQLLRRIELPRADDEPLIYGNPFDRYGVVGEPTGA